MDGLPETHPEAFVCILTHGVWLPEAHRIPPVCIPRAYAGRLPETHLDQLPEPQSGQARAVPRGLQTNRAGSGPHTQTRTARKGLDVEPWEAWRLRAQERRRARGVEAWRVQEPYVGCTRRPSQ